MFKISTIIRGRCYYLKEGNATYEWVEGKCLASSWYTKTMAKQVKLCYGLSDLCEITLGDEL